jgi:molecular chaperone GrpE
LSRKDQNDKEAGIEIPVTGTEEAAGEESEDTAGGAEPVTLSREEYDALVKEAEQAKEQYMLAVADFENFRKRVQREKEDIVCFANEKLIFELLPILDNLQRALSMELDRAGTESILEGLRMVTGQLHSILGACGLEPVDAVGGPFDPQYHEAVGVLPSDEHDEGTVISELQKGYSLKGKILRPSMVHVAGQPSGTNGNEGDN